MSEVLFLWLTGAHVVQLHDTFFFCVCVSHWMMIGGRKCISSERLPKQIWRCLSTRVCALPRHNSVSCTLCPVVRTRRTIARTNAFESSSFVLCRQCVFALAADQVRYLCFCVCVHLRERGEPSVHAATTSLACVRLTVLYPATVLCECMSRNYWWKRLWSCSDLTAAPGDNEEIGFAQIGTTQQSNVVVALLSHSSQDDWIEAAKVCI